MATHQSQGPESYPVSDVLSSPQPLGTVVCSYIKRMAPSYLEGIGDGGLMLLDEAHSTPAFRNPDEEPRLAVSLPLAADQEMRYIGHTLQQYAAQEIPPPYSLVLFANYLPDANRARVGRTLEIVRQFISSNPRVPVGYVTGELKGEVTIANVRKYVGDLALCFLWGKSTLRDALILNHDADTRWLHPRYLQRMDKKFMSAEGRAAVVHSHVRHSRDPSGRLANMDLVNAWNELSSTVDIFNQYYDLGVGLSARAYTAVQGYDVRYLGLETRAVVNAIIEGTDPSWLPIQRRAPGAELVTSARRPYEKLSQGTHPTEFWSEQDFEGEVFFAPTSYRNRSSSGLQDISAEARDRHIRRIVLDPEMGLLKIFAAEYARRNPSLSDAAAASKARRAVRIAWLRMGGPADLLEGAPEWEPIRIKQ